MGRRGKVGSGGSGVVEGGIKDRSDGVDMLSRSNKDSRSKKSKTSVEERKDV